MKRIPRPDQLNVPPANFLEYTTLIYGTKGIGKTSLASTFPDCVVIMTEPLRKNLEIRQLSLHVNTVPQLMDKAEDAWEVFKEVIAEASEDPTVQCLAIDTVDRLYEACLNHHCLQAKVLHPGGLNDYGQLWSLIKDDFEVTLNGIRMLGMGLLLISHAKETEIELVTGGKATMYGPSCSAAATRYIKGACDYAFFLGYHGKQRCLHLRGDENIWTACGPANRFVSPQGRPVEILEMPSDISKGYQLLSDGFANKLYDLYEDVVETPKTKRVSK
jgi:hypothetical protein